MPPRNANQPWVVNKIYLTVIVTAVTSFFGTLFIRHLPAPPASQVLASEIEVPTSTPFPTPEPTLTPRPTRVPTKVPPRPTSTPTPIPAPKFTSEQINQFIDRFSGQYGVDPNAIRHLAVCESGFNPLALNARYDYAGLFQFAPRTWSSYRQKMGENPDPGLRFNAEEAVQTAAYAYSLTHGSIWPVCHP
jgi:hypothetical protein